jgi:hypothetical protein
MSRAKAPSRANTNVAHANNNAQARANQAQARANTTNPRTNTAHARTNTTNPRTNSARALANGTTTTPTTSANPSLSTYRYGTGSNPRHYQATGYGRGYRNHYSAGRSGYGRSQGNTRGIVSRLRSVHRSLARIDHDYRGHRVQAMHSISAAIRQLSHRSISSGNMGLMNGQNNVLGTGTGTTRRPGANGLNGNLAANGLNGNRGVNGLNGNRGANGLNGNLGANGGRGNQRLTQFQSDARMAQALRTTQGIAMQMGNQGTSSSGHMRAQHHLHQAVHHMNTALAVR